jgi:glycosyltransferase involved in cell wall biosynthesis
MAAIVCNTRIMAFPMSGVQRVTGEILCRLNGRVEQVAPRKPLSGWPGHLWEQTLLPLQMRDRLLWSPSATGPLAVTRQVISLHDIAFIDHPEFFSTEFAGFYSRLLSRLVRRVRHIITVSQFSKSRIANRFGVPADKISVVLNGVADTFRPYSPDECAAVAHTLKLPTRRYVLAQATADQRKNLRRTVEAWSAVASAISDDIWLVVTGNPDRSHIFGPSRPPPPGPRIFRLGFVSEEDLPVLTAGALGFVYPSLYEGFGLPILEAMASGTPVITSDITALPEVAGGAALLVSPHSVPDISGGIIRLLESGELREKHRQAGLANAHRFSWDRAALETLEILERFAPPIRFEQ